MKVIKRSFFIVILVSYFFIFGRPLPVEISVVPEWSLDLNKSSFSDPDPDSSPGPFKLNDSFGYIYNDGRLTYLEKSMYGVAIDKNGFINYSRQNDLLVVRNSEGDFLNTITIPGYPFFSGGRRFIIFYDNSRISEIDESGALLWEKSFGALITSVHAVSGYIFVGTIDGKFQIMDNAGETLFTYADNKSRINVIYGGAVSDNGELFLTLSGIDPQVVSLWVKDNSSYRVESRWAVSEEVRRQASMGFSEDGQFAYVEAENTFLVVDLKKKRLKSINLSGRLQSVDFPGDDSLIHVLGKDDSGYYLTAFETSGNQLFFKRLDGEDIMFKKDSSVIVLGIGSRLFGFSVESM